MANSAQCWKVSPTTSSLEGEFMLADIWPIKILYFSFKNMLMSKKIVNFFLFLGISIMFSHQLIRALSEICIIKFCFCVFQCI